MSKLMASNGRDLWYLSSQTLTEQNGGFNSVIIGGSSSDFTSEQGSSSGSQLCFSDNELNDEFAAELTRQMADSMFLDDDKHEKTWLDSGSPQSTLWSPFGSDFVSPVYQSREPSPPLIETFKKMKINEEIRNSVPAMTLKNPKSEIQSKQSLIDDQIRAVKANFQFNKVKLGKEKKNLERRPQNGAVLPKNQNQPPQRGGKAGFLDGSGSGFGSGGTGVFLPRETGYPIGSRNRTGCARVVIPARVVQALNQHFDKVGVPSKFSSCFPPHQDVVLVKNKKSLDSDSDPNSELKKVGPTKNNREIRLPQEWTY